MKKTFALMAAVAALAVLAFAAVSPTLYQGNDTGSGVMRIKPQAVPTSLTVVTAVDAHIIQITAENPTAGAIAFTAQCNESPNVAPLPAVSIAANSASTASYPARYWCPGGFSVLAGGAGLTYSAKWGQ